MSTKIPKVIIIGAGFAGLKVAKKISKTCASIVLIDRNNFHTFVPLLYQVSTCFISPEIVTYPLRKFLRFNNNIDFLQAEVIGIDFSTKIVRTNRRDINYDYLVIATGSKTKFLGVDGAPQHTYSLRTLNDAVVLRNHILSTFEEALTCVNEKQRKQLLTFTIVGGGATGVELAGALVELIRGSLAKDYRNFGLDQVKIILVHSGDRLLADFPEHLGDYTRKQLLSRGVKIYFQTRVNSVTPGAIELDDGLIIDTSTVIWTAGVEANLPIDSDRIATATKDQVRVRSTLQLLDHPEVYAIGDVACVEFDNKPLLGIAPEALQQGAAVANNLKRQFQGFTPKPFNYFNKGTAAIVARNAGVAYLFGRIPLKGLLAWLLWLGIHLYYLPGISNRLTVLFSWIRDYLTQERNVRQIWLADDTSKTLTK